MPASDQNITQILFDKAQTLHKSPRIPITFTRIPESDALLNNIEQYPHFFVLGCIMDRQILAEKAWNIPYIISRECGGINFENFLSMNLDDLNAVFSEKQLHRFNEQMAGHFSKAIKRIHSEYHDNAANIWLTGQPGCREVIARFAQFSGVGQKISTMATNILVREFKVPLKNVHEIDISVDSQIEKVFKRMGLVPADASRDDIIVAARKIYPEYPGIADSVIWEIGRDWCKNDLSGCHKCFLNEYCPKIRLPSDPGENDHGNQKKIQPVSSQKRYGSGSTKIKANKYRLEFEELLKLYPRIIPRNFYIRSTASRTNAVIKAKDISEGIHYEFNDWHNKISVELLFNRVSASSRVPVGFSKKTFDNLPEPVVVNQSNWIRLQFFFGDDKQSLVIAEAMNELIRQTYPEIHKE